MTTPLRGAIVGFGAVAENGHLPGWRRDPRFEIVAIAEPRHARRALAEKLVPGARFYDSIGALLDRERLDFVDIASPPTLHIEAILAAANAGVHILCEKPLVTSRQEFHRAVRTASEAKVVLHPVHNWKHAEAYRLLGEIRGGTAPCSREYLLRPPARSRAEEDAASLSCSGPPRELRFRVERNGWSVSDGDWRAARRFAGGGILIDHGWHAFYLALGLIDGAPRRVRATIDKRRYPDADVEDTAHCEIEFDSCLVSIELSWAGHVRETLWSMQMPGCHIEIRDDAVHLRCSNGESVRRLGTSLSEGSHHADWFPEVAASFARALGDRPFAAASLQEAAWCIAILEAAYASAARSGQPIEIIPPES